MTNPEPGSIAASKPPAATVRRRQLEGLALFRALQRYDRTAFFEVLGLALDCGPTPEALRDFADTYPDRWGTLVKALAGVAGFTTDRTEAVTLDLSKLSDSQLEERLTMLVQRLGKGKALDAEAIPAAHSAEATTAGVQPSHSGEEDT
jgi:hypothetical protein